MIRVDADDQPRKPDLGTHRGNRAKKGPLAMKAFKCRCKGRGKGPIKSNLLKVATGKGREIGGMRHGDH